MEPGIWFDVPRADYDALPYVNASALKRLFHSPAAFRYGLREHESRAMKGGTYTHMAVLEPERFAETVLVAPRFHSKWSDESAIRNGFDGGKEALAVFEAENGVRYLGDGAWESVAGSPVSIVPAEVYAASNGIALAVMDCPAARALLTTGRSEVTLVWDDPTGVRCKARIDHLLENNVGGWTIADLKQTTSTRPEAFRHEVERLRMHLQAAFYLRGLLHIHGAKPEPTFGDGYAFAWVAFETRPPHFCRVYKLGGTTRESANIELERMLRVVAWCEKNNSWPDYSEKVATMDTGPYYEQYKLPEDYVEVDP